MKKIFALALLLGLGMMVGCGDDVKPKATSAKPTMAAAKPTGDAAPAAGTGDKK